MKDSREKLSSLDELAKRLSVGDDDLSDLISKDASMSQKLTQARNMSEEALARQILKNTGVPIPGPGKTRGQVEDYLQRMLAETHPEVKSPVRIIDNPTVQGELVSGYYSPVSKEIVVGSQVVKRSPTEALATVLHEGAHDYDSNQRGFTGVNRFKSEDVKDILKYRPDENPFALYEAGAKTHHANIPGLREGTFGFGGLKSYLKNGVFRAMGPISAASQVTPAIADLKEGNPNTAAARMVSGLAPMGSEKLQDDLMQKAQLEDKSPYLLDPTYQRTLKAIGDRRMKMGKSPVVEAFGGEQIDTSATEDSDYLNALKKRLLEKSGT